MKKLLTFYLTTAAATTAFAQQENVLKINIFSPIVKNI